MWVPESLAGEFRKSFSGVVKAEVLGPERRAVQPEEAAAREDAVDDGGGEVLVVEDLAPGVEGLLVVKINHPR